ncbi:MAG: hypothetical protein M1326_08440, partial [Cyanobacteria bacterium]|nr:hypothetical protein [Cyanobacteriota bacterium]
DGKIVSAFWNLNIYTNQRHLTLGLSILLAFVLVLVIFEQKKKQIPFFLSIIFGALLAALPFLHASVFVMFYVTLMSFMILFPRQRKSLIIIFLMGIITSIDRVSSLERTTFFSPKFNPNYLISAPFTIFSFLNYWFYNLGLSFFLIPLGLFFSSRFQKKIFIPFLLLFLIGHTIQFSPEIAGNHKFFNAFLIVGNIYVAYSVLRIWKINYFSKVISPLIIFILIFSGFIDFFPVKNDHYIFLPDYPVNSDIRWIIKNTEPNSNFLNSSYLYNPASLAGRKIFLGWPYFAWSIGYDTQERDNIRKNLFSTNNLKYFCNNVQKYKLKYILTEDTTEIYINRSFLDKNFKKIYRNPSTGLTIYETKPPC